MNRIFRALDVFLGLTLFSALGMGLFTALPGSAQAATESSATQTERRGLAEFETISVAGSFEVRVRQAPQAGVEVRAPANLLPLIETVIDGDKHLLIRWKQGTSFYNSPRVLIEVSTPRLHSLASSGSSNIRLDGLTSPQLAASISGSGDMQLLGLACDELKLRIAGSGDITASGRATKTNLSIAGSGNVRSEQLKADDVRISIAGSGDASVHADKTLSISIAGSGDVSYSGNAEVKTSKAGSGSVRKR